MMGNYNVSIMLFLLVLILTRELAVSNEYSLHQMKDGVTWEEGRQLCIYQGMDLAVINDDSTWKEVQGYLHTTTSGLSEDIWIGLIWNAIQHGFLWVNNEPLWEEHWYTGEPNCMESSGVNCSFKLLNQSCVRLSVTQRLHWKTYTCNGQYDFLCQKLSSPNVDTTYQTTSPGTTYRQSSPDTTYLQTSPDTTYLQTSPDTTHLQTSLDTTYLQTSPDTTHLQTSPDATYLQTSPEATHLQTTPDTTFLQTSLDTTYLQTSPDTTYLQTSPEATHLQTTPDTTFLHTSPDTTYQPTSPEATHLPTTPEPTHLETTTEVTHLQTSPSPALPQNSPSPIYLQTSPSTTSVQTPQTTLYDASAIPTSLQRSTIGQSSTDTCVSCKCNVTMSAYWDSIDNTQRIYKVDKKKTSSYKRLHGCAEDNRFSAKVMGYVGYIVIGSVLLLIVAIDLSRFQTIALCKRKDRLANSFDRV